MSAVPLPSSFMNIAGALLRALEASALYDDIISRPAAYAAGAAGRNLFGSSTPKAVKQAALAVALMRLWFELQEEFVHIKEAQERTLRSITGAFPSPTTMSPLGPWLDISLHSTAVVGHLIKQLRVVALMFNALTAEGDQIDRLFVNADVILARVLEGGGEQNLFSTLNLDFCRSFLQPHFPSDAELRENLKALRVYRLFADVLATETPQVVLPPLAKPLTLPFTRLTENQQTS